MTAVVAKDTKWEPDQHDVTPIDGNVYAALAAAQLEFGTVQKGSVNPAFKSKYADLADVASVVIPPLAKRHVAVLHYLVGDSLGAMRTEFVHAPSGTKVWCDIPLLVDKQNMQGMKSATTYAKRIGLESLSGVAPEDDDGNAASSAAPIERITDEELRMIEDMIEATGTDIRKFLGWVWAGVPGTHTLAEIHRGPMYEKAMNALRAKKSQGAKA